MVSMTPKVQGTEALVVPAAAVRDPVPLGPHTRGEGLHGESASPGWSWRSSSAGREQQLAVPGWITRFFTQHSFQGCQRKTANYKHTFWETKEVMLNLGHLVPFKDSGRALNVPYGPSPLVQRGQSNGDELLLYLTPKPPTHRFHGSAMRVNR